MLVNILFKSFNVCYSSAQTVINSPPYESELSSVFVYILLKYVFRRKEKNILNHYTQSPRVRI